MASELQALLRFLAQDAKVPLATAMSKVKFLQKSELDTPEKLAKVKPAELSSIFPDEKIAKQVLAAAKRVSKKRAAGDDASATSPAKKIRKNASLFHDKDDLTPAEYETSLALPSSTESEEDLDKVVLFTNRAPLALAFVFTLLKHTMPEQPLSSRLSLAQGYIGVTSKARALYLGIDTGTSAEQEGFGEGQPSVWITGKEIRVLKRWGYEWKGESEVDKKNDDGDAEGADGKAEMEQEEQPPLWALDLEALKKSNTLDSVPALGHMNKGGESNLPIHRPEAARSYLLKAFDTPPAESATGQKKVSAAAKVAEKERNLGRLLRALDLVYESWATTLSPEDLDKRTWGWYVKVRPAVAEGAAGWGGKNKVELADILHLRRKGSIANTT
jgi:hypothetical protein